MSEPLELYLEEEEEEEEEDGDEIPFVCLACGGPYPGCVESCKIFDPS